ncbi:MAG: Gfo/Idh/MocA family oxidoreductase [Acidobacteria bacterium]|nr:Gfo/Idh/MocA family oxidoreductase [Acidobacteriota bacterium]
MSTLRWGVLGTARVIRHLVPVLHDQPRARLVAIASRDAARAVECAHTWQIPEAVHGYAALLARDDIDAVYLPLPNALHAPWVIAAAAAGKHVLCEKPLGVTPEEVDRMQTAAMSHRVVVTEGLMYRHEPLTAEVCHRLAGGAVGRVHGIVSGFTYHRTRPDDVRLSAALGGGALFDVGVYPVSYACLLAQHAPEAATATAMLGLEGVDDMCQAALRFPGETLASITAGFRAATHTWLTVLGSEGTLEVPEPFKPGPQAVITTIRDGQKQDDVVTGSPRLFDRMVADFTAAVIDGTPPVVTLDDSRRTAEALALIRTAAGLR